jgi:ribokinase
MNMKPATPSPVAVVGSCGIGLTLRLERVPGSGETVSGATFAQGPGGKGSNQAIAIRRLGIDARLFTIVGDDAHGRSLLALWESEGVDASAVLVGSAATMVGAILVEPSGENRIVVAPGVLDELSPDSLASFAGLESAAALLVNLEIPPATAAAALRRARDAGVLTVLNPAPAGPLPTQAWAAVDHVTPNRGEAEALAGLSRNAEPDALVDALRELCQGAIVLTLGAEGALVDSDGVREVVAAVPVEHIVDTTGAGDAFSAAYVVALVEGASPVEAARFAVRAGAFAVTREEVIPALPRRDDLEPAAVRAGSA